ncbi:MAG: EAL domain-containing protein [Oculatellaceae cyanobacterium Prado106]|nr:EAL domain-containing protein [Oculatellaceae cyanobacterium Prado106]
MPRFSNCLRLRKFPLRLILVLPFVLQIFAAVGLTGWISLQNGQKAVNDLAAQLRNEVSARIEQKLIEHLKTPPLINQTNVDAIAQNLIDPNNHEATTTYILKQLQRHPNITGITVATETPNYVGAVKKDNGSILLTLWDRSRGGAIDIDLDDKGKWLTQTSYPDYDHRKRPWYQATINAGEPIWQEPYVTINPLRLVISADQPYYDAQGNLLGVWDAEQTLLSISEFLRSLRIGKSGRTFIMEQTGELIASSTEQEPFLTKPGGKEPERLKAIDSADRLVQGTAKYLTQTVRSFSHIKDSQAFDFTLDRQHLFAQVMPFHQAGGLDWLVVVTVPESDFMEAIEANTRTTIGLCLAALAIATGIGIITAERLVQPLLRMVHAADSLSRGDWQQRVPEAVSQEFSLLARAFNRMAGHLRDSFARLEYNAYHDALTGLPNHAAFLTRLESAIARTQSDRQLSDHQLPNPRPNSFFAVLFLDLDYFKLVNDSLGHLVGDQLLVEVAERLRTCVSAPALATPIEGSVARFGGDEFIVLLDRISDITDATQVAARISTAIQRPFNLQGNEIFISTSVGIVLSTTGSGQPDTYLRNADIALYRAKSNGKASFEVFDAEMHTEAVERLQLETDLRRAIERQELAVYYQPIIDLKTEEICGFEALARWHHPTLGMVSPVKFIPLAEETGLIIKLGWWVLQEACRQTAIWQETGMKLAGDRPPLFISVNLSSKQFLQADLIDQILHALEITHLPAHSLKLEITESILMNHSETTRAKLKRLTAAGIELSVDDFGTGYSSLSYLHRFPIQTLKIDRSFISRLGANGEHLEIVEAIIALAHKLGMQVVAEGVETAEQLQQLQAIGCEYAQGYLFSPPVPAAAALQLLPQELVL